MLTGKVVHVATRAAEAALGALRAWLEAADGAEPAGDSAGVRRARLAAARPDLRMKLKEDYYSFRDTTTLIFILTPLVLLLGMWRADSIVKNQSGAHTFSPVLSAAVQCYIAWIIYFYTAVALRENILVVNGSNIRTWWMQHHYISIFMGLLMLTMPVESEAFKTFGKRMMVFNLLQGLVMFMQTHCQRKRLYTRIAAMGKNSKTAVQRVISNQGATTSRPWAQPAARTPRSPAAQQQHSNTQELVHAPSVASTSGAPVEPSSRPRPSGCLLYTSPSPRD